VKTSAAPGVPRGVWQAGGMTERSAGSDDPSQPTRPLEHGASSVAGARSPRPGHVRRPGDWRWDDRDRRRTRCGQPGLRVALVEKDDFASGTSSKSSKMAHGGLRYLQQREFRLVYENLAERHDSSTMPAPHHAPPLPDPAVRPRRRGVEDRRALLLLGVVALRPDRGYRIGKRHRRIGRHERSSTSRPCTRTASSPASSTTTRVATTRGGAHPGAHCRAVVRRGRRPTTAGRRVPHDEAGRVIGARVAPRRMGDEPDRDPIDVRANVVVMPRACGPTRCARSTKATSPPRSGQQRVSTSRCRGRASTVTSPR